MSPGPSVLQPYDFGNIVKQFASTIPKDGWNDATPQQLAANPALSAELKKLSAGQNQLTQVQSKQQAIPGLIQQGNIDLTKRPIVKNSDGTISTVRSISVNVDGKEVLIPTVSEDGRILTNEQAIQQFKLTGKHLGIFNSVDAANAYAQKLHEDQAKMYAPR